MIKAVLFDMDGVLIDAKEWHYDALNDALRLFIAPISRDEHLATYDGLPTARKLELLALSRGLPVELHKFINKLKQEKTIELIWQRCRPTFSHQYLLSRLKAANYKIGVCSNSIAATVELMMKKSALDRYLDIKLSNEDVQRAKPDPEIYLTAMEALGVRPTETLILEDNEHGLKAAKDSGAHILRIGTTLDVNVTNVFARIAEIDGETKQ